MLAALCCLIAMANVPVCIVLEVILLVSFGAVLGAAWYGNSKSYFVLGGEESPITNVNAQGARLNVKFNQKEYDQMQFIQSDAEKAANIGTVKMNIGQFGGKAKTVFYVDHFAEFKLAIEESVAESNRLEKEEKRRHHEY